MIRKQLRYPKNGKVRGRREKPAEETGKKGKNGTGPKAKDSRGGRSSWPERHTGERTDVAETGIQGKLLSPMDECKRKRILADRVNDSLPIGWQWRECSRPGLDQSAFLRLVETRSDRMAFDKTAWHALEAAAKMTRHKGRSFVRPTRHRRRSWQGETADTKRVLSCW